MLPRIRPALGRHSAAGRRKGGRNLVRQGDLPLGWARGSIGVASRKAAGRAQMKRGGGAGRGFLELSLPAAGPFSPESRRRACAPQV